MIDIIGKSHIGQRPLNEDRFVADTGWGVALVSDGMGGPASGEVAAAIVASSVVDMLDEGLPMAEAVMQAHEAVRTAAGDGRGKPGMGATLVVARFDGHDFQLSWIGDSRAYLWCGELHLLSRDHSRVEALLARGAITLEQAGQRGDKNLITRAMGLGDMQLADIPVRRGTLCQQQQLLLCSDGLNDVLSAAEIATIMGSDLSPADKLDDLVGAAVSGGGKDNITAVLVTAGADAPEPGSAEPLAPVAITDRDGETQYFRPEASGQNDE